MGADEGTATNPPTLYLKPCQQGPRPPVGDRRRHYETSPLELKPLTTRATKQSQEKTDPSDENTDGKRKVQHAHQDLDNINTQATDHPLTMVAVGIL